MCVWGRKAGKKRAQHCSSQGQGAKQGEVSELQEGLSSDAGGGAAERMERREKKEATRPSWPQMLPSRQTTC